VVVTPGRLHVSAPSFSAGRRRLEPSRSSSFANDPSVLLRFLNSAAERAHAARPTPNNWPLTWRRQAAASCSRSQVLLRQFARAGELFGLFSTLSNRAPPVQKTTTDDKKCPFASILSARDRLGQGGQPKRQCVLPARLHRIRVRPPLWLDHGEWLYSCVVSLAQFSANCITRHQFSELSSSAAAAASGPPLRLPQRLLLIDQKGSGLHERKQVEEASATPAACGPAAFGLRRRPESAYLFGRRTV
jgi:hypothetical protein